jgi:predicted metal-binding protein
MNSVPLLGHPVSALPFIIAYHFHFCKHFFKNRLSFLSLAIAAVLCYTVINIQKEKEFMIMTEHPLIARITAIAKDCGAYQVGIVPTHGLTVYPEVRAMCEKNTCRGYGATWACPPAVGPIEDCLAKVKRYDTLLLFTGKYELEDSFDYEGMVDGMKRFQTLAAAIDHRLKNELEDYLMLSNEGCHKCKTCTYPDAPCRFPDELHPSLEAFGFNVSELACLGGINYINGPNTVTYFGGVCVIST